MRKVFSNILGCMVLLFLLLSAGINLAQAQTTTQPFNPYTYGNIPGVTPPPTFNTNNDTPAATPATNTEGEQVNTATTDARARANAATTAANDFVGPPAAAANSAATAGVPSGTSSSSILAGNEITPPTPPAEETAWQWWTLIGGYLGILMRIQAWLVTVVTFLISGVLDFVTRAMESVLFFSLNTDNYNPNIAGTGSAIQMGWVLIRDLLNLAFIFLLLKNSIEAIMGKGVDQKLIRDVIIAALFVNFSLYITELVIDFYNIFAVSLFNSIKQVIASGAGGDNIGQNITLVMFSIANINPFAGDFSTPDAILSGGTAIYIKAYTMLGFMVASIYVFFKITLMFLSRGIAFMILMITSPIYFIGPLVPQLQGYAKKWFPELNAAGLSAPLFLIFLFIVIKMINDPVFINMGRNLGMGGKGDVGGILYFILIVGFLLKSLEIVKENSGSLGTYIDSKAKQGLGLAVGATAAVVTGGTALATRGAAMATLRNKQLLSEAAREGVGGDAARAKLAAAQRRYENPLLGMEKYGKYGNKAMGLVGIKADTKNFEFMMPDLKAKYDMKNPPKSLKDELKAAILPNGYDGADKDLKKKQREIGKTLIGARKDKEKEENEITAEEIAKKHGPTAEQKSAYKVADDTHKAALAEAKKVEDKYKETYEKDSDVKALNKVAGQLENLDKRLESASLKFMALKTAGASSKDLADARQVVDDLSAEQKLKLTAKSVILTNISNKSKPGAELEGLTNASGEFELDSAKQAEIVKAKEDYALANSGKSFTDLETERKTTLKDITDAEGKVRVETQKMSQQANTLNTEVTAITEAARKAAENLKTSAITQAQYDAEMATLANQTKILLNNIAGTGAAGAIYNTVGSKESEELKNVAERIASGKMTAVEAQNYMETLSNEIKSRKRRQVNDIRNLMRES